MAKTKEKLREICTYHSNDGTSGYCLSDKQFKQIEDLISQAEQQTGKKIFKQMNQCSSMTETIKILEKIEEEYGEK